MSATEHNLEAWVSRLGSLTAAVNADYDLHALLDLVADAARDLLGLDLCGVMMPSAEGDSLDIVGASGLPEEYVERVNVEHRVRIERRATAGAPASRAFLSGEPCAVSDIHREPVSRWVQTAREQGYRSILAVPLRTSAGILGTLNSYRNFAHTFAPKEVEQLMLLAEHAAIAITSARIRDDLRAQHELILRSEEIHSKMLDVAVLSGGVDGIAAVLGGLFTCAVVIRDTNGEILGSFAHPVAERADQGTDSARVGPNTRALGERGLVHQEGRHVVVNVVLDHSVVATAWLLDMAGHLDALGVRAAEHASVVLSLEILRQRTAAEAEQRVRGELLTDLLAGVDPDLPQIRERAKLLGHDLSKPHRLLVASACGPPRNTPRRARGAATHDDDRAIHRAAVAAVRLTSHARPRPLIAAVRDLVIALWPTDLDEPSGEKTLRRALLGHAASRALVMTSDLEDGIAETHTALVGALRLVLAGGSKGGVMALDELGVAGLLLRYAEPAHLQRYADRTLGAVTRYDARHGSELLHTLRTYLDCDLDRAATAEHLTVHVNTVSQRLRRIEKLSGLSLRSPRQAIDARTALMLMQIAGGNAT
ncbi:helix-turn-helix domain-containing protein [Nocardia carnea]|uniref:helix-turn-helix domain-containing protein n=1 Tax=Nocardia carnea TaxID=37328 RepID=UPI002458CCFC|nr:helix-turn-helix domain-containing protein [Nocardia carnea]